MTALVTLHLPLLAEAPQGISKLRQLILELAVHGLLLQQDATDVPASRELDLLARGRLSGGAGRARKPRANSDGDAAEPYLIPPSWQWCKLADVVDVLNGRAYKKEELLAAGTPVLRVGNLFTSNHWYFSDLVLDDDKYCQAGDLIFAWSASFGPFIWSGERVIFHYHIWKLRPHVETAISKLYLNLFLQERTQAIKAAGHGVSMAHMTKEKMEALPVALPPLAEQHRIVAKVEELMALCDRLEARQQDAEAAHARLVQVLLESLTQARNFEEFQSSWQQVADHFETLLLSEDSLEALKACIRKLALRGRLVAQEPSEEPADELLKRVALQRYGLTGGRRVSNEGRSSSNENKCPHEIPCSWVWCRLEDIQVFTNGYAFKSSDLHDGPGVGVVKIGDVYRNGEILEDKMQFVDSELASGVEKKFYVAPGDMVITMTGEVKIGFNNSKKYYLLNQRVGKMRYIEVEQNYVFLQLIDVAKSKIENASGGVIPNVSTTEINDTLVPLPPLAEQRRIVAKVSELFVLCDQLKARITAARAKHAQLAEALVEAAVA